MSHERQYNCRCAVDSKLETLAQIDNVAKEEKRVPARK